jgi:hypothetical protein
MNKWSFEWTTAFEETLGVWLQSKKIVNTEIEATKLAIIWVEICLRNEFPIAIRLVKVKAE